jgi:hypothetical protein
VGQAGIEHPIWNYRGDEMKTYIVKVACLYEDGKVVHAYRSVKANAKYTAETKAKWQVMNERQPVRCWIAGTQEID